MRFDGHTAIVTGGGSGIGRATAQRLAEHGCRVAVLDVDLEKAETTAASIAEDGGQAGAWQVDVTDSAGIRTVVDDLVHRWQRIDVLVNNAAIAAADEVTQIADDDWDREIAVALGGTFRMTREALPVMRTGGGGAIVNMGSVNARSAYGQEAYSAAKAGIESLTRSTAVRYAADGVRANTVVAGTVRTPAWDERVAADPTVFDQVARHYPLGRVGEPRDVAAAICFLASSEASWITGASLLVDGGLVAAGAGLLAAVSAPSGSADR